LTETTLQTLCSRFTAQDRRLVLSGTRPPTFLSDTLYLVHLRMCVVRHATAGQPWLAKPMRLARSVARRLE